MASLVGAATVAFGMLSGFFGGGSDGLNVSVIVVLFGTGWSLLPAIRASRGFALLAAIAWLDLALKLLQFGAQGARGWMFGPWIIATCGVAACLLFKPPKYGLLDKGPRGGESNSLDHNENSP